MDGIVQETSARHMQVNQNISATATDFEAWDSIAGHSSGLNKVRDVIFQTRKKTNPAPVDIPYRHGIVHGMDVNFNHKSVAAKAWALLFAVGEWTHLAQDKKLEQPPPTQPKSMGEQVKEIIATQRNTEFLRASMASFKPRSTWAEGKIPATGEVDAYEAATPERALAQFLAWWRKRNYGMMAGAITKIGKGTKPDEIRAWFDKVELLKWHLLDVRDEGIGRASVRVHLTTKGPKGQTERERDIVFTRRLDAATTADEIAATSWTFFDYHQFLR
jgi:hypothetical protein